MTINHMKICLISLVIKEMKLNNTMKYVFTQQHKCNNKWKITSVGKDTEKLESSYLAGGNMKWFIHYKKRVSFPKKLNIKLPDDSTVPLPDIYSKEMKTGTVRNTFT